MTERVTVQEQLFERLGIKIVTTSDGEVRDVPRGELPEPTDNLLARMVEPTFTVSLRQVLRDDVDVTDELGLALRRVAKRLFQVMPDGREVPGEQGPVETIVGPTVHEGAVMMFLDTDDSGYGRAMIDGIVGVFVDELAPLTVPTHISASSAASYEAGPPWVSSVERLE
jgi:hypothetical protein